jgi:RING finger protein 26
MLCTFLNKLALNNGENRQNATKPNYVLEREKDKRLCVICQDNVTNILLMPCRHVCMCQQCLNKIRQGRVQLAQCPLCRTHIQSTLEVFV